MPVLEITLRPLAQLLVLISYRLEQPSFPNHKKKYKVFPPESRVISFIIFVCVFLFFFPVLVSLHNKPNLIIPTS